VSGVVSHGVLPRAVRRVRVPNLELGGGAVFARNHLRENCGAV
jgi:hypothetical protein